VKVDKNGRQVRDPSAMKPWEELNADFVTPDRINNLRNLVP